MSAAAARGRQRQSQHNDDLNTHTSVKGKITTARQRRGAPKKNSEAVSDRVGRVRGRGEAAHTGRRQGKGAATMKLTTMTQVTLDGVTQGNGGASEEDRRNGFERGGWARGKGDGDTAAFINQTYDRA